MLEAHNLRTHAPMFITGSALSLMLPVRLSEACPILVTSSFQGSMALRSLPRTRWQPHGLSMCLTLSQVRDRMRLHNLRLVVLLVLPFMRTIQSSLEISLAC